MCTCMRCERRRLSPSFKVKVEVKYRNQVSVPLTLRAFIVTQHDKDNILSWQPDDLDQDKVRVDGVGAV